MNGKLDFVVLLVLLTYVYSMSTIDDDVYAKHPEEEDDYTDKDSIVESTTSASLESVDDKDSVVETTTLVSSNQEVTSYEEDDDDDDDDDDNEVEDDIYNDYRDYRWFLVLLSLARSRLVNHLFDYKKNVTVSEEIGPKFQSRQFFGLLRQDFRKAYQRTCTKISGDESAFDQFMDAKDELKNCTDKWRHSEDDTFKKAFKAKDYPALAMAFCQKRNGLMDCVNDFKVLKDRCSFPAEIARTDFIRNILKAYMDSICSNGGADLVSLLSRDGEGRKCIQTNRNEFRTCRNKAAYAITKRLLTKFIETEHFEFKMNKDDCNEFDAVMDCFVSSVENCADPTAKDQITSIFTIFRDQTSCAAAT